MQTHAHKFTKLCSGRHIKKLLIALGLLCPTYFLSPISWAQDDTIVSQKGNSLFDLNCARCHGGDANGGEYGPSIIAAYSAVTDDALLAYLQKGNPAKGMPAINLPTSDLQLIVGYLRALAPFGAFNPASTQELRTVTFTDGTQVTGVVLSEGREDLQLRTTETNKLLLLRREDEKHYRQVTSQVNWESYDGLTRGYRHTKLQQLTKENAKNLQVRWSKPLQVPGMVQTTPVVVDGVMYVTYRNNIWALDAGTGREIWHWQREFTEGLSGNATFGANRGVAVKEDKLFFLTDNAHMIALDRHQGTLLWESTMADWNKNYNSTNAPLVTDSLVIGGHAGGDEGVRGFIVAYHQDNGEEAWRFQTIPEWGTAGSETWPNANTLTHGGGSTWMTGSFDPELNLLYWPIGNPGPDLYGHDREGDNLFTDSVVALDADTGELRWHYQFTPHDIHDWDAQEPLALIDTTWQGEPRKLLLQANRNGFFYVLDRVSGELLLAKPFVDKLNWAEGIGSDGRPKLQDLPTANTGERYTCPGLIGATNWYSTGYLSNENLYIVQALEACNLFAERTQEWKPHQSYMGGVARAAPDDSPQRYLLGIDISSGERVIKLEHGPATGMTSPGVLTTDTGLIIFSENSGSLIITDSTGEILWEYFANVDAWRASPMAYEFDGEQHIAIAIGDKIVSFGLPRSK
jgi:alcohol dehydrogenase (cytochrome c)